MAKTETKSAQLSLRSLQEALLVAALPRIAHVLRPFPKDATPEALTEALTVLRQKKLVHGSDRQPNLTPAGVEAAKAMAGR